VKPSISYIKPGTVNVVLVKQMQCHHIVICNQLDNFVYAHAFAFHKGITRLIASDIAFVAELTHPAYFVSYMHVTNDIDNDNLKSTCAPPAWER
jgi:hypothetical protein